MLTLGRIDCMTRWRKVCVWGKELGLLFYASLLSYSLSFTFLKLFFYTQSIVCLLYLFRVLYSVRSPCFIPSQWSAVYDLYWLNPVTTMKIKFVFLTMLLCQMSGKFRSPVEEGGIPQKGTVFWNNNNNITVIFLQVWTRDQKKTCSCRVQM